jgi:hypothetical protein
VGVRDRIVHDVTVLCVIYVSTPPPPPTQWDVVSDKEAAVVALSTDDAGIAAKRLRDFAFARGR